MILDGCMFCGSELYQTGYCPVCHSTPVDQREAQQVECPPKVRLFCNLCGTESIGKPYEYCLCGGMLLPVTPNSTKPLILCAECANVLDNYICPKCDTDLVNDITTEYHPYLWEMDMGDQLNAHAMGVAL